MMQVERLQFPINETTYLQLDLEYLVGTLRAHVRFIEDEDSIALSNDAISWLFCLGSFHSIIGKVLRNELVLTDNEISNIGVDFDAIRAERSPELLEQWNGMNFLIWKWNRWTAYNAWMYNRSDGAVVLEITPTFHDKLYNSPIHLMWLDMYAPIFKAEISRDTLENWYAILNAKVIAPE